MPGRRLIVPVATAGLFVALTGARLVGAAGGPSFVDPSATATNGANIKLGELVYVGPFAEGRASLGPAGSIEIGDESNVQDNVLLDTANGPITIGQRVILAHGATVKGQASLGRAGRCPSAPAICAAFVSFNAEVDGATIEKDAMVQALSRVGPGVTLPSGRKTIPGATIASNAEVAAKTLPVVAADREFMRGVIEVNTSFAEEYARLREEDETLTWGINNNPGNSQFNPLRHLPILAGQPTRDPDFRNRIIGDVELADDRATLDLVMGNQIALRADEGEPFEVGTIDWMSDQTVFHALEHSHLQLGNGGRYGYHSIVHGGPTPFKDTTITGDNFELGDWAVFFRSRIGPNSRVGFKSLVQASDLPANTVVPDCTIIIEGQVAGRVESCDPDANQ